VDAGSHRDALHNGTGGVVLYEQEGRCVEVFVNGELQQLPEGMTVTQLLEKMALADNRLAVEVNLEIVPRSCHVSHILRAGDRVEIVHAIGGG
jgi:sulfur carrier protein